MSSELIFRDFLSDQHNATLLPDVSLTDLANTLDESTLARLTVDRLRLRLSMEKKGLDFRDFTEQQQKADYALEMREKCLVRKFETETAIEVLELLADLTKAAQAREPIPAAKRIYTWKIRLAVDTVLGFQGEKLELLRDPMLALLAHQHEHSTISFALSAVVGACLPPSSTAIVIAMMAGEPASIGSPFLVPQLEISNSLAAINPALCLQIAIRMDNNPGSPEYNQVDPPGHYLFAQVDDFLTCAKPALEKALRIVESIHNNNVPYKSDKAFDRSDAPAISRFVGVALDRHANWLPSLLDSLLLKVSTAPTPDAKTAPSQATAYAIAIAIAERPTVECWLTLKAVTQQVKHASLKKRLQRQLKKGEQRLTRARGFLRTWPADSDMPRALATGAKQAFEYMLINNDHFTVQEFSSMLQARALSKIATTLIWVQQLPQGPESTFKIICKKACLQFITDTGNTLVPAPDATIRLLHPIDFSQAVLEHWRQWLLKSKIRQAFNQLFRETYTLDSRMISDSKSNQFANFSVDGATVVGLGHTKGWHLSRPDGFEIRIREYLFLFQCGDVSPGYEGIVDTGSLLARKGTEAIDFHSLPLCVVSEAYRAVDLLVSVAAFSATPDYEDQDFTTATNRRDLLKRFYPDTKHATAPYIDGRYLCVGEVRIHIGTGRASRQGETIEYKPSRKAVQLPYPDSTLEKIIHTANAIESG